MPRAHTTGWRQAATTAAWRTRTAPLRASTDPSSAPSRRPCCGAPAATLEGFLAQRQVLTLPPGRPPGNCRIQVVDDRHIIHSLRRKPIEPRSGSMPHLAVSVLALLNLVYRDALFPRPAYRAAWERLLAAGDPRAACGTMVGLLALAHERGCEAELADALACQLADGRVPDLASLCARFAPDKAPKSAPDVVVTLPPIASYDALLPSLAAPPEDTVKGATE